MFLSPLQPDAAVGPTVDPVRCGEMAGPSFRTHVRGAVCNQAERQVTTMR